MNRYALGNTAFALLLLTSFAAQAAEPTREATSADLLLASSRIDNYSIIVPTGRDWKAVDAPPANKPSCSSQLWTLFVDKDSIERPFATAAGDWAVGILATQTKPEQVTSWATANVAPGVALVVTPDYVICGPTAEKARGLGVFVVGSREPIAKKQGGPLLPSSMKVPGSEELGFMQGFLFALKFWQEAPDADGVVYLAGKYAGTAVLLIVAGIIALFLVMFLIKKTIKTAIILPLKIITWPIRCLFCRKKKEDD